MKIALDFDQCYTEDYELWDAFIKAAEERGHLVYIVTARYEHEALPSIPVPAERIMYTCRKAKRWFMTGRGIEIDIWIDDAPDFILKDHGSLLAWDDERMDEFIASDSKYKEIYGRNK